MASIKNILWLQFLIRAQICVIKMGKYKGNVVNDLKFIIMDKIAINNEIVSAVSALFNSWIACMRKSEL